MHAHWDTLYACDFFAVETLGLFGPVRHMVFFVVKLETREVHIAGIRVDPDGAWMKQVARNDHYHHERFHQGIGSSLISPNAANDNSTNGEVRCRSRLGGLLTFYYREAA